MKVGDLTIDFIIHHIEAKDELKSTANAAEKAEKSTKKLGVTTTSTSAKLAKYGLVLQGVVQGYQLMSSSLGGLIEKSNEYRLSQLALTNVARSFGQDIDKAREYAERLAEDGLMKLSDAQAGLKNLIRLGYDIDQAYTMAQSLKNIGAFNNIVGDLGQAFNDATKGLMTNSAELFENIGLTFRLSNVIGNNINLTKDATQRQKLYNAVLSEGNKFAGDAARLAEDNLGKQARMKNELDAIRASAGDFLTNILMPILQPVGVLFKMINNASPGLKNLIYLIGGITSATVAFSFAMKALNLSMGPIGWILTALSFAIMGLYSAWKNNMFGLQKITKIVVAYVKYYFKTLWEGIKGYIGMLKDFYVGLFKIFTGNWKEGLKQITGMFKNNFKDITKHSKELKDELKKINEEYAKPEGKQGINQRTDNFVKNLDRIKEKVKEIGRTIRAEFVDKQHESYRLISELSMENITEVENQRREAFRNNLETMRNIYYQYTGELFNAEKSLQERIKGVWRITRNILIKLFQDQLYGILKNRFGGTIGSAGGGSPWLSLLGLPLMFLDSGGYTGDGGRYEPAGIVHRGEVVFEKPIAQPNLRELLGIRKMMQHGIPLKEIVGYAGGGLVGASASPTFMGAQTRLLAEMTNQNRMMLLKLEGLLKKDTNIILQGTLSGQEFYRKTVLPNEKAWKGRKIG